MGVLVVASLLPDIDVAATLVDPDFAALERRTLTHSVIGLPVLGFGLALVVGKLVPALDRYTILFLIFIGASVHLLLDLINGYGVALLYPLSSERFELPLLFIIDPVVLGVLAATLGAIYLCRSKHAVAVWLARGAFAAIAIYLLAALYFREAAQHALNQLTPATVKPAFTYLAPEPFVPFRWKGIYAQADAFGQAVIYPFTGSVRHLGSVHSDSDNPLVLRVRNEAIAQEIEALLKAPVWSVCGRRVSVYDLRFRFFGLANSWDPFGFVFDVDRDGVKLVETGIGARGRQAIQAILWPDGHASENGATQCGSESIQSVGAAPTGKLDRTSTPIRAVDKEHSTAAAIATPPRQWRLVRHSSTSPHPIP
jgi:membrane-bound metal-dependent hydrolase YbcI (DUF457 family)